MFINKFTFRFLIFIRNFIEIFDALISILTLTFYNPNLNFMFFAWESKFKLKNKKHDFRDFRK